MNKSSDTLLLSTKLKMPAPRHDYVIRRALFDKLSRCQEMSVIFICGGAGTGKTTLLSSFIKEKKIKNVGWLSLDATNSNIYSFWHYFAAATRTFLGDDDEFLAMFCSSLDTSYMKNLLTMLINKLCSDEDYYIVLDDVHCINDKALMETLEFFIGAMPENLHIFMLSREEPPVYLGALAVSGRLLFIDGRQMQLSADESMAFLKQTLKLSCSDDELSKLNTYAEGWIGGLQLAAAARMTGKNSGMLLRAGGGIAAEYLTREIFESLTQNEQDFLLGTGFLSYFDVQICKKLFDNYSQADFNDMIEELTNKNLFIICIDEQNKVYRYHNILSEYLMQQFSHLPADRKKMLLTKSADAFEQRDDLEEALRELCIAGDYENVMRVAHKMNGSIEAWCYIDRVPLDMLIKDADLAAQCFMYNIGKLNVERCRIVFLKFKEQYEDTDIFHIIQFAEAYISSENGALPKYHTLTAEQINRLKIGSVTKSMILVQNANALIERMQYEEAENCLNKADSTCNGANAFVEFFSYNERAQLYEETGRLNESLECYERVSKFFKNPLMLSGVGMNFYIGLTGVYMRQMEVDKAEKALKKAQEISSKYRTQIYYLDITLDFHVTEIKLLNGQPDACAEYVENVLNKYHSLNIINLARLVHELDCEGMLKPELADKYLNNLEQADEYKAQPFMRLIRARIIFEHGNTSEALKETESIMTFAREHKNKLRLVEADLLKIFMLSQCTSIPEQQRQIKNLLREAIYYAYENRILLPFYLDRHILLPLLQDLSRQSSDKNGLNDEESAFVREAIAICSKTSSAPKDQEILSTRELDVLNALAQGITNREIAEKLCISPSTVKTHVLNIFGKLGVSTRLLAVEEARKRGLIK